MGGRVFPAVNVWGVGCGAGLTLKRCNQFGALREEEREGGTIAESLVGRSRTRKGAVARSIERVSTRSGEGGGQLDRRRVRGVLNPCAREFKVRTGRFLRGKLISGHSLFPSYESQQGAANGQDSINRSIFEGHTGLRTAEC